jgi:Bifunctional DNA primase/polymerase, N-terminal
MFSVQAAKPVTASCDEPALVIEQLGGKPDHSDTQFTDNSQDNLAVALDYAARGFQVFPLKPRSKEPATRRGLYEATSNTATLRRYFTGAHPYNIAIRTGVPSNVFVLDVDGEQGLNSLAGLVEQHGLLPPTLTSTTGKGRHYWFVARSPMPCSVGKIAPGIDIRGDGGYVVVPPSIHPNGAVYRWVNDEPPADAPDWLLKSARHRPEVAPPRITHPVTCSDNYCRAALEREVRSVADAIEGGRNHALNRASFSLHQLVAIGKLDAGDVVNRLIQAAHACGLLQDDSQRQVMATIRSGAKAGLLCPRRLP